MTLQELTEMAYPANAPEVGNWTISNRDEKRHLITYVRKDGKLSVTFSKDGWVAANPKAKYATVDSARTPRPNIKNVLGDLDSATGDEREDTERTDQDYINRNK